MQRSLEWVQPHMLKEMTFDLMAGEERVATYRPRNAWKQSAIIESDGTRLTITPNTFQTEWTVTEGDDLEVTT